MEAPLTNAFDQKLYGRVYDVLSPLFLRAKERAEGNVIFLSGAIQQMEEKAKEMQGMQGKAVVTYDGQGDDQVMDDEVEENERRDAEPSALGKSCKRPRERQREQPASRKKRKR